MRQKDGMTEWWTKQTLNAPLSFYGGGIITERLKFQDFNICPNILHVDADADADAGGIAIALLH